jgi:hypothetical protein
MASNKLKNDSSTCEQQWDWERVKQQWQDSEQKTAMTIHWGEGKQFRLTLGKLVLGLVVVALLPFKMMLLAGAALFALHHCRKNQADTDAPRKRKPKNDEADFV